VSHVETRFGRSEPARPLVRPRPAQSVEAHPVFAALPPAARDAILSGARERLLPPGEALPSTPMLWLVGSGLLVRQASDSAVCVGLIGPGSALGWETAATGETFAVRALDACRLWEAPIQPVIEIMGQAWLNELVARQAALRLKALETDAACNASHLLLPRLAKWLARFHRASGGQSLALTQAALAEMLGVQRTSVNAAALQLQAAGLARFRRGRVEVLDADGLRATACACV